MATINPIPTNHTLAFDLTCKRGPERDAWELLSWPARDTRDKDPRVVAQGRAS
jgi:hypothetical protein